MQSKSVFKLKCDHMNLKLLGYLTCKFIKIYLGRENAHSVTRLLSYALHGAKIGVLSASCIAF